MRTFYKTNPRRATVILAFALCFLTDSASAQDGTASGLDVVPPPINAYYSELHPCAQHCESKNPSNWTVYSSYDDLKTCKESMLFDFNIYNSVTDPDTPTKIRACTIGNASTTVNALFEGTGSKPSPDDATTAAVRSLQDFYGNSANAANSSFMLAYHQGVVAGVYVGQAFDRKTIPDAIKSVPTSQLSLSPQTIAQLCGSNRTVEKTFGLVVDTEGNIADVQDTFRSWAESKCAPTEGRSKTKFLDGASIWKSSLGLVKTRRALWHRYAAGQDLHSRQATCRIIRVVSGDGCGTLATKCGISGADFTKYNTKANLCSTLQVGQPVCCSAGNLPDIKPKPNADGTCASHLVVSGDNCGALAGYNGLEIKDIEKFNNGTTWGWNGCASLATDMYICLSTGKPPLPFPIPNAVCGPMKPGTKLPTGNQQLKDLNPCPLNACCNVWGQCGVIGVFCTEKKSATGNPGTSGIKDGCVSSCGTQIKNKDKKPTSYGRIGYYEAWNFNRTCLWQRVENSNTDGTYTHIHWAFAEVNTKDWTVKIDDKYKQWVDFKGMKSLKRIVSFGGWGYSTEPATYDILRQAMSPANRDKFASNVASFITKEGIDGVDFDWEYPGAIDIPGTPPGQESDGPNYLAFLTTMRSKIHSGKTLSIAAPASFWYLKAFPIEKMAAQLDYIVYMTYDLHGQWDAGNEWAMEGCKAGNCLRSHVNLTETEAVLAMITKAGVSTNKLFVGESSYGRSFKMAKAGCKGPMCTFTGDRLNSQAKPGDCTGTPGYISNAEISRIITLGSVPIDSWYDKDSGSDMLVYDNTEWVAYMSDNTKKSRRDKWKGLNFAGTIDWAVDLQSFTDDEFVDRKTFGEVVDDQKLPKPLSACTAKYDTLDALAAARDKMPEHCIAIYTAETLQKMLAAALKDYDAVMADGYDKKFNTYAEAVARSGQKALDTWMYDHGNDYFTCDVVEEVPCCSYCHYVNNPENGQCRYCEKYDCGWESVCEQPEVQCGDVKTRWKNITGPCPPDYSLRAGPKPVTGYGQSIYWHLRPGKQDAWYAQLYADTGISEENIKIANLHRYSCAPTDKDCDKRNWDYGFPKTDDYNKDDVVNPKDVVGGAHKKIKEVAPQIEQAVLRVRQGLWSLDGGRDEDLGDAIALPVLMIQEAVKNMKDINDTVEKWEDEKRKGIILAFLSAIFFFVPVLGQVAGTISTLATVGRIMVILGTVGEVATEIYSVVDDKNNLPLAIFSIILAPLAILDAVQMGKAATRFRDMSPNDIKGLGKNLNDGINKYKGVNNVCKLAKRDYFDGFGGGLGAGLPMSGLNGEAMWAKF